MNFGGQGNVLVEAILDGPIVVIKDPRTGKNRVIDPGHIGEQLMGFRQLEAQLVIKVRAHEQRTQTYRRFEKFLIYVDGLCRSGLFLQRLRISHVHGFARHVLCEIVTLILCKLVVTGG